MPGRTVGVAMALAFGILCTARPADAQWNTVPSVTVSAPAQDPRLQLAFDAVNFWVGFSPRWHQHNHDVV